MKNFLKEFIFIVSLLIIIVAVFSFFVKPTSPEGNSLTLSSLQKPKEISLSQLVQDVNKGEVEKIEISGTSITISYKNNKKAVAYKEPETSLLELLNSLGTNKEKLQKVNFSFKKETNIAFWGTFLLLGVLPFFIFIIFFWMLFRKAKAGATQAFDFTKSKARLFGAGGRLKEKVTFKDVAGLKEAKEELMEIVDFLKFPQKYLKMGAKIPRGVLLVGPAGCGKTLLARAVAGEANVPFLSISGSEFVELFVGVGAARVRSLFQEAKKRQPSIVFIDELDAIGKMRGPATITGGHEEREQTLNQLLVEMDGFEREDKVIVISATNRPDVLDSALLRPGRFDRKVVVDLPDIKEREAILRIHSVGKPLADNVNFRELAERTPGFSGADLENAMNEAAILAAKLNKNQIEQKDLITSIEKVLLGPERKSHVLSKKEKEIAAYHEAGHALLSALIKEAEPVRKVSIISRGMAAGYTLKTPKEERRLKTKSEFLAEITVLLGGYVSEKIKFGEMTTGASNDLEKASSMARKLVKEYGMSSLGPISFEDIEKTGFLFGYGWKPYSEEIAAKIDKEVEKIIEKCEKRAKKLIRSHKKLLEKIATTLVKKETIEKEEFEKIVRKKRRKNLN